MNDTTRKVYYMGRRVHASKLCHYFMDADDPDNVWFYPKAKASNFRGIIIGRAYNVDQPETNKTVLPNYWFDIAVEDDVHDLAEEWQAKTLSEITAHKLLKCSPTPELDELTDRLVFLVSDLTPVARMHFLTYLISKFKSLL